MAGVLGSTIQWRAFQVALDDPKRKHGFHIFRATAFKHRSGEFAGWSPQKCLCLISDLSDLTGNGAMHGAVLSVKNAEYEAQYRTKDTPTRLRLDTKYGLSFRLCFVHLNLSSAITSQEIRPDPSSHCARNRPSARRCCGTCLPRRGNSAPKSRLRSRGRHHLCRQELMRSADGSRLSGAYHIHAGGKLGTPATRLRSEERTREGQFDPFRLRSWWIYRIPGVADTAMGDWALSPFQGALRRPSGLMTFLSARSIAQGLSSTPSSG